MKIKVRKRSKKMAKKAKTKIRRDELLEIEYVDIDSVKLWEDNPRRNDAAAKKLSKLIKQHGLKSPIVCTRKDRVIRKGNTTLKAARLLGYKKVPVTFVDFPSKRQAELYGISDNRAGEFSEWDDGLLAELLGRRSKIPKEQLAVMTGFSQLEIEGLETGWEPVEEPAPTDGANKGTIRCPFCSKTFKLDVT